MWLALDIGNSRIKAGLFEEGTLRQTFSLAADREASVAAFRHSFRHYLKGQTPERIGLASVVPPLTDKVARALQAETWTPVEHIHTGLHLPFELHYRREQLGADRLAAVAGAFGRLQERFPEGTVFIMDAGTALTIEVLSPMKHYRGGLIAPGPRLMLRALHRETAQLPETVLQLPPRLTGKATEEALQSGVLYGFVEMVRGLLSRLQQEHGTPDYVLATGGWAPLLARELPEWIRETAPHLVLEGIHLLMHLNTRDPAFYRIG